MTGPDTHAANKRAVASNLRSLVSEPLESLSEVIAATYAGNAALCAFHPVNHAVGVDAIADVLWKPLREAFPDIERRDQIVAAGRYEDSDYVCLMSALTGTFARPWLGIPASQNVTTLRCCEMNRVQDGVIAESYVLIDTLDVMRQANVWPIAPSLGAEEPWPAPETGDGVNLDVCDHARGAEALRLVKAMHAGLAQFDGEDLTSMDHARFWTREFMWYGPSGIGTTRGLDEFEAHHQIPFLRAFPDRRVDRHIANIGDGDFVVTGGWPSLIATHTGPDWLGVGPTGRPIGLRVMDFYRLAGDLIAENWVPIDVVDVLRQIGVDVFARVRHRAGYPRRDL